ncbi:MAG: hypothetical protein GY953_07015 [bacterium]|nr:hypothetical protein [bacterium]
MACHDVALWPAKRLLQVEMEYDGKETRETLAEEGLSLEGEEGYLAVSIGDVVRNAK